MAPKCYLIRYLVLEYTSDILELNKIFRYDLLQWRNEMYNSVIEAFKDFGQTNPQLHHLGYRDKAWNVNKLAHIARKQGLQEVCVKILDKMYGHSTMEVQVAFLCMHIDNYELECGYYLILPVFVGWILRYPCYLLQAHFLMINLYQYSGKH